MTDYLRRVTDAANNARNNAAVIEARLRKQIQEELAKDQTAVDIAAAEALRSGNSRAAIGRAMGTKDYYTYIASINRGLRLIGSNGTELTSSGLIIDKINNSLYIQRGDEKAEFAVVDLYDDNGMLVAEFYSQTPLWDEKYDKKNSLVAELDSADSGKLYEEVLAWLKAH